MMQKRKAGGVSGTPPVLPVTTDDAAKAEKAMNNGGPTRRKKRQRQPGGEGGNAIWGVGKLFMAIIGIGLTVVFIQRNALHLKHGRHHFAQMVHKHMDRARRIVLQHRQSEPPISFKSYPSLHYPLQNAKVIALYFASAWCPQSTPITTKIDELFGDILMKPPDKDNPINLPQRHGLALVYVSSDNSSDEMEGNLKKNWIPIPWNSPERNNLKRHFKTCAKAEESNLEIKDRKHEIPALIILSGTTDEVLSYTGIRDIEEHGAQALDQWLQLDKLASSLDAKFVEER